MIPVRSAEKINNNIMDHSRTQTYYLMPMKWSEIAESLRNTDRSTACTCCHL
jgi:hypothetical protein